MPRVLNAQQRGRHLEDRVVALFKALGKWNVSRSLRIKDDRGAWSEIDVVYGWGPWRTYIECKNYSRPVPLEAVAKFKTVLELNHIPLRQGLFITTSTYSPRARHIGLRCLDGVELEALEATAGRPLLRQGLTAVFMFIAGGVCGVGADDAWQRFREPPPPKSSWW